MATKILQVFGGGLSEENMGDNLWISSGFKGGLMWCCGDLMGFFMGFNEWDLMVIWFMAFTGTEL